MKFAQFEEWLNWYILSRFQITEQSTFYVLRRSAFNQQWHWHVFPVPQGSVGPSNNRINRICQQQNHFPQRNGAQPENREIVLFKILKLSYFAIFSFAIQCREAIYNKFCDDHDNLRLIGPTSCFTNVCLVNKYQLI